MSESKYPRVGDRVKVTYEGVVTKAEDALHRHFDVDGVTLPKTYTATIVPLERWFPVGTVAISKVDPAHPAVRGKDGRWGVEGVSDWHGLTDRLVATNPNFVIIHEPSNS